MICYITGIAGFLGSHLAEHLRAQGHEVRGCDNLLTGSWENIPWATYRKNNGLDTVITKDIATLQSYNLRGVDVVYHLAAAAYEGLSVFSPSYISRNIYAGSAAVFSAAIAAGVKRIVFCSSMARYGVSTYRLPFDEDMAPRPVDPYGIAKEAAERLLCSLCRAHGVEYSISVPHNIYGPRQAVDPYRNVATIFATLLLAGKQVYIYGTGHQTRCFSYVDDVVPYLARMGHESSTDGQIINLGPDTDAVSILDLGRMIADIIGVGFDPIFLAPRPLEVPHAVCSAAKARRLLGFEQRTLLKHGLEKLVAWIERHPRSFHYHMPIEIQGATLPTTWAKQLI